MCSITSKVESSPSELFLKRLQKSAGNGSTSVESIANGDMPDLSDAGISERMNEARHELYRIIKKYLSDKASLYQVADKLLSSGSDALKAVANHDDRYLRKNSFSRNCLEVIVKTDGSRPSFLITNGRVDKESSPAGVWANLVDAFEEEITKALTAVGRINLNDEHVGTGFLIHPDFIITNRHVLQEIAEKQTNGDWLMNPDANINFGFEYETAPIISRSIKKVIFCGSKYIDGRVIDHSKLDLALVELASADKKPVHFFGISAKQDWAIEGKELLIMGYPGDPGIGGLVLYKSLLEELFESTFGYKRLAPGNVMKGGYDFAKYTMGHDTTTLGGNSGSVIVLAGNPMVAAGLHYGGSVQQPRINWGHLLANTMDATNGVSSKTLKEHLNEIGVDDH